MPRHRQRPTLADVAERAGVSPITVSRVINSSDLVKPDTRMRVLEAIEVLGYRSNMAARTLAGGRSRVLGVLSLEGEYFGPANTLFGIESAAREVDHTVTFVAVGEPTVDALRAGFAQLAAAHVEGFIVVAPVVEAVEALEAIRPETPIVVAASVGDAHSSVSVDQARGAELAVDHLLELGHRTVHHVRGASRWIDTQARIDGWRRALEASRAPVPEVIPGDWSPRSGYLAGQELARDRSVTAVFVANDQMALGVVLAFAEAGRDVPGDVSIVGFDDTPESAYYHPPLTTVRQDLREVGRQSVEVLLRVAAGGPPERIEIEPMLVARASSAAP